jgi:hypothetical protein
MTLRLSDFRADHRSPLEDSLYTILLQVEYTPGLGKSKKKSNNFMESRIYDIPACNIFVLRILHWTE